MFSPEEEMEWADAKPEQIAKDLPAGVYDAVFKGIRMGVSKRDGGKFFVLKYRILSGPYKDQTYEHFLGLSSQTQMAFARSVFEVLGAMTPGEKVALKDVEGKVGACSGIQIVFELYENGQYVNCKVLRTLNGAVVPPPSDDDAPW